MITAAAYLSITASCFPMYKSYEEMMIKFSPGSADIADPVRWETTARLSPLIGEPLAEIDVEVSFLWGTKEGDDDYELARSRAEIVRSDILEIGLSPSLVGGAADGDWVRRRSELRSIPGYIRPRSSRRGEGPVFCEGGLSSVTRPRSQIKSVPSLPPLGLGLHTFDSARGGLRTFDDRAAERLLSGPTPTSAAGASLTK